MNSNSKNFIIGVMSAVIIILAVLITLSFTGTINYMENKDTSIDNKIDEEDNTTNDDANINLPMSYTGEYTFNKKYDATDYNATLDLMEDGTFYTYESMSMAKYYYGTYEVINNKITLNYKFTMSSTSMSATKINKTIEYTIDTNNNIIGSKNNEDVFGSADDITLTKSSDTCKIINKFTENLILLASE